MWQAGEPRGPQYYNVNWIGPTIMKYGNPEQQDYHLKRMRQGDVIWSQGFSEPSGGSDLAAMRTKAERKGDRTSSTAPRSGRPMPGSRNSASCWPAPAPESARSRCFCCRWTGPASPSARSQSVVGDGDFHEVFFDDVEALESELLGPQDKGWEVVRFALNFERIGIPRYALALRTLHRAVDALIADDAFAPVAQAAAATAYAACEAAQVARPMKSSTSARRAIRRPAPPAWRGLPSSMPSAR